MNEENRLYEKIGAMGADIASMKDMMKTLVENSTILTADTSEVKKDIHQIKEWKSTQAEPTLADYRNIKQRAMGVAGLLIFIGGVMPMVFQALWDSFFPKS